MFTKLLDTAVAYALDCSCRRERRAWEVHEDEDRLRVAEATVRANLLTPRDIIPAVLNIEGKQRDNQARISGSQGMNLLAAVYCRISVLCCVPREVPRTTDYRWISEGLRLD